MNMALVLPIPFSERGIQYLGFKSAFQLPITDRIRRHGKDSVSVRKSKNGTLSICSSVPKLVQDRSLDRHVRKQNRIRFVQKLRTLLLSKPKHYMSLHVLSKCRSYLTLSKPRSILAMIERYPTLFELFYIPYPPTPLNATKTNSQLCVRLTPAAESLSRREAYLKSTISLTLASKLQKLLMLTPHRRLVLSKLAHLGPDLGLPTNFRSCLCNEYPDKFKTVDTSYGRALELVSWDPELSNPLKQFGNQKRKLIVDRPSKFKLVKLRKGMNVKRRHHDFLIKFGELPNICPYNTSFEDFDKISIEAEKRACSVVREILGMTIEKRTLIDHLTHFRKDFGLPNRLRAMLVRHPELFYISLKGERDSVFLVEAYDDNGELIEKDESLFIKDQLFELVKQGKRIRRQRKLALANDGVIIDDHCVAVVSHDLEPYGDGNEDEGLEDLFEWDESDFEIFEEDSDDDEYGQNVDISSERRFWISEGFVRGDNDTDTIEPW